MDNRILRKSKDRILAGVAGGTAEFFGWPVNKGRLIWGLAGLFSGGGAIIIYTICAFVFPPPSNFDINDFRK